MEIQNNSSAGSNKKERPDQGAFFFLCLVFLAAAALDQLTKYFTSIGRDSFRNYVFAFSLPFPLWLIYIIYALVLGWVIFYVCKYHRNFSFWAKLAWTLIFAGAFSNIAERIILGYVRDFIYITLYRWTGIYNLADMYILLGIAILFFAENKKGNSHNEIPPKLGIRN